MKYSRLFIFLKQLWWWSLLFFWWWIPQVLITFVHNLSSFPASLVRSILFREGKSYKNKDRNMRIIFKIKSPTLFCTVARNSHGITRGMDGKRATTSSWKTSKKNHMKSSRVKAQKHFQIWSFAMCAILVIFDRCFSRFADDWWSQRFFMGAKDSFVKLKVP